MKVLIDATPLLIRSAGVKNYLYHWIRAMRRAASAGTIETLPSLDQDAALNHERSVAGRWDTYKWLARLAMANHTSLDPFRTMADRADVFHVSGLLRHPSPKARLTTTLHDLTTWMMPELHPKANREADLTLAEHLRRAHRIIAVSECSRQDAVKVLRLPPSKIQVIYPGIADAFFDVPPQRVKDVRVRYGLKRPFVLSIGTVEPRKNMAGLISAFQSMPASLLDEFDLVIAGPMGWVNKDTEERVRTVRYLGYVPECDIAPLTAGAAIFAYPSLYEGFGFPVVQAMAAGIPVITSNVSALPEVAGDAAVLVDPRSQSEICDALTRLLLYPAVGKRFADRGRQRAEQFRWDICATKSLQFFREVVDN